jgi:FKBP-type peptidyl-prolyl cis-trans isomerase FklB
MIRIFFMVAMALPSVIFAQSKPKTVAKPAVSKAANPLKNNLDSFSYAIGSNIGMNLKQSSVSKLNTAMLAKALSDALGGKQLLMTPQIAGSVINAYFAPIAAKQAVAMRAPGEKFLAENKTKPGVISLPNGLQYQILTQGTGPIPADTNKVMVAYAGTFIDGTPFDSSPPGQPYEVNLQGGVIDGWLYILRIMPVGSKWKVFIPYNLAYGDQGRDGIKPGEALIFEMELVSIVK